MSDSRSASLRRSPLLFLCLALAFVGCRGHHGASATPTSPDESSEGAGQTAIAGQRTADIDALRRNETVVAALKGPGAASTPTPRPPTVTAFALAADRDIWVATSA